MIELKYKDIEDLKNGGWDLQKEFKDFQDVEDKKVVLILAFCWSDVNMLNFVLASIFNNGLFEGQKIGEKLEAIPIKSCQLTRNLQREKSVSFFDKEQGIIIMKLIHTTDCNDTLGGSLGQRTKRCCELVESVLQKYIDKVNLANSSKMSGNYKFFFKVPKHFLPSQSDVTNSEYFVAADILPTEELTVKGLILIKIPDILVVPKFLIDK